MGGAVAACLATALVLGLGANAAIGSRQRSGPGPAALRGDGAAGGAAHQAVVGAGPEPRHIRPATAGAGHRPTQPPPPPPLGTAAPEPEVLQNITAMKQLEEHLKKASVEEMEVASTTVLKLPAQNKTAADAEAEEEEKHEEHKVCKGGSRAACQCLLSCSVFGGEPDHCDVRERLAADRERNVMLHRLIDAALTDTHDACEGMRCIVDCARQLDCFDTKVEGDCKSFINRTSQDDCQLNCAAGSAAPPSNAALLQAMNEEEDVEYGHEPFHFKK